MTPPSRGGRPRRAADEDLVLSRRRKRRRNDRKHTRRRAVVFGLLAAIVLVLAVGGTAVTSVASFGSSCDLEALQPVAIGENSFMYAADGSTLGVIPAERNRQPVTMKQISPWLPKATVAIEDRRFYEHGGIDPSGIARAVWADVRAGKVVQGGSTIPQQLVRNLYPVSRERTLERKLKEACLAIKLNRAWPKERILVTYMNQVYYGNLAYGIEAAAQTYFSKPAKSLNLPEAALLAGMPQAPSDYDPFNREALATQRRNQVLRALLETGDISRGQYEWALRRGLGLKPGKLYTTIREPYFFSYVRDQLIAEYGANTVRSGDADFTLRRLYTSSANRLGYANPDLDTILNDAAAASDQEQRAALYAEACRLYDEGRAVTAASLGVTDQHHEDQATAVRRRAR